MTKKVMAKKVMASDVNSFISKRLVHYVTSLSSEGYVIVGKIDSSMMLRHVNGNRITLTCVNNVIALIKNGRLVKTELPPTST